MHKTPVRTTPSRARRELGSRGQPALREDSPCRPSSSVLALLVSEGAELAGEAVGSAVDGEMLDLLAKVTDVQ